MGLIKIIVIIWNSIFLVASAALLGWSIWLVAAEQGQDYLDIAKVAGLDEEFCQIAVYTMIGVGGAMFIISLIGLLGACCESRCLLIINSIIVLLAMAGQAASITFLTIFYYSMDSTVDEHMQYNLQTYYESENSTDPISSAWNYMQIKWKCCGSKNYRDYDGSNFQYNFSVPVPWTCCVLDGNPSPDSATINDVRDYPQCLAEAQQLLPTSKSYLHSSGCYKELEDMVFFWLPLFIGLLSAFLFIQMWGVIFTCILACKAKNKVDSSKQ